MFLLVYVALLYFVLKKHLYKRLSNFLLCFVENTNKYTYAAISISLYMIHKYMLYLAIAMQLELFKLLCELLQPFRRNTNQTI